MAVGCVVDRDENISNTDDVFLLELQREKPNRYNSKQLKTITSDFSKHLGSGSFGNVFKGTLEDGVEVAVKVLKETTLSLSDMIKDQFKAEVSTLCKTNHRNLVQLYGYCFEPDMKALVYEFMENGSLDSILKWEMLWNIAIGTANGLSYLHQGCQPSIIHYDIKPSNILLDSQNSPKIGDFGLAKLLNSNTTHVTVSGFRGTPKYAAPELSQPFFLSKTTHKCDVFSYGMLMFDLVSRRYRGHDKASFYRQVKTFVNGQEGELVKDCGIEKHNVEKAKIILKLASKCVAYFPDDRPSMREVLIHLEGRELEIPPNSFPRTAARSSTFQYLEASYVSAPINNNRLAIPNVDSGSASSISQNMRLSSLKAEINRNQFATPELEDELDAEILKPYGEKKKPPGSTLILKIRLHCEECSKRIKKIISKYKGVYDVKTELPMNLVTVHGVMDVSTLVPFLIEKLKVSVGIVLPKQGDQGKKGGGDEGEKKVDSEINVTKELVAVKGVKALQPSLEKEVKRKVEIVPPKKQREPKKAGGDDGEKKTGVNVEGDKKADDVGQKAKGRHGGEKKPSWKVEGMEMEYYGAQNFPHTYNDETNYCLNTPRTFSYHDLPQPLKDQYLRKPFLPFSDENPNACSIM